MKQIKTILGKIKHKKTAFTLIEMAVVLFIISLLMLLILPNLNNQRKKAAATQSDAMVSVVQTQVSLYENETDDNDVTYADLVSDKYLTDKQAKKAQELGIKISGTNVSK
ncbi:prepilin-type N-terminal cleavage/methylation domain-containing protein [Oenococcus sicerae]|uniref:Prepilin-type N-terminal cleavage/methylation domain-containing protein n=1 Tax=Oenococcus sicerae TaxID=2203724 RepID=A0AAJ1VP35_9LACO|nr:competence type IV pilus major pilin ComGC [Oenococcus sicerae]MDN6900844.1 prepilin-type N-terminal cleavage/methylation domain-containing protein [Oenococcus sicerae]QAS69121.1 prepilin-type N-terminal cleavage/methylation domain-containing protein [Oenococcus sicerae]